MSKWGGGGALCMCVTFNLSAIVLFCKEAVTELWHRMVTFRPLHREDEQWELLANTYSSVQV